MSSSKIIFAALFVLGASAVTCSARLGETFDECQTRYGLLVKVDSGSRSDYPQFCFQKDGIEIRVRFLNSHSAQEVFTGLAGKMSDTSVADLLNANAQGSTWSAIDVGHAKTYTRQDAKATAHYIRSKDPRRDTLTLETAEFTQIFKAPGTGF
jgi:hypothetical protein